MNREYGGQQQREKSNRSRLNSSIIGSTSKLQQEQPASREKSNSRLVVGAASNSQILVGAASNSQAIAVAVGVDQQQKCQQLKGSQIVVGATSSRSSLQVVVGAASKCSSIVVEEDNSSLQVGEVEEDSSSSRKGREEVFYICQSNQEKIQPVAQHNMQQRGREEVCKCQKGRQQSVLLKLCKKSGQASNRSSQIAYIWSNLSQFISIAYMCPGRT